jgi:hypothetical protein
LRLSITYKDGQVDIIEDVVPSFSVEEEPPSVAVISVHNEVMSEDIPLSDIISIFWDNKKE